MEASSSSSLHGSWLLSSLSCTDGLLLPWPLALFVVSSQSEKRLPVQAAFSHSLICLGFVVGKAEQGSGCGTGWMVSVGSGAETEVNRAGLELICGMKWKGLGMAGNSKPVLLLSGVILGPKEGITQVSPSLRV